MKTYGLVGKSGTGKSYQALSVCRERGISCIIDDGLFIGKNKIYSGRSAKRSGTKIGAVKTALFTEEDHQNQVIRSIQERKPESILILGTSEEMIRRIASRLGIPEPKEIIRIEDVSEERDMEVAHKQRFEMGKHAIPVATFQLKHEFSGYILDPLKIFRSVGTRKTMVAEKSEVRPTYSYLGKYIISENAISDIVRCVGEFFPEIRKIAKILVVNSNQGLEMHADIFLSYGCRVQQIAELFQKKLKEELENMTAFHVLSVNLTIKGLV